MRVQGQGSVRVLLGGCLAWLSLLPACGASDSEAPGAAGEPSAVAGGVNPSSGSGAIPSAGGAPGAGSGSTTGGTMNAAATGGSAPTNSSGGKGNGDDGDLFPPESSVPFDPTVGGAGGTPAVGGAGGKNTDGATITSQIGGSGVNGSAKFTQTGADVTVVVKLTKCPNGTIGLHINNGDSCDNMGTEGKPWDGKRGNIGDSGSITCNNNSANLTYTRSGSDPALKWTIGDHASTDITFYVVIASTNADGSGSYIGCGNFFK